MIVMKLAGIKGDCKIEGYKDWITLESFSFGVNRSVEILRGGADVQVKKSEPQEISISKSVDCATVDLMYRAIQNRRPQGGGSASGGNSGNLPVTADIHFVAPQSDKEGKSLKPYLRVKLGRVLISEWSLDGNADERPTENLTLHFTQIAMDYHATADGKVFTRFGPRTWDSAANDNWKVPDADWSNKGLSDGSKSPGA